MLIVVKKHFIMNKTIQSILVGRQVFKVMEKGYKWVRLTGPLFILVFPSVRPLVSTSLEVR